jgi:predicted dehydrogenase
MKSILVVGCGNIGYRHLQAVATLKGLDTIGVVEKNSERLHEVTLGSLKPTSDARLKGYGDLQQALKDVEAWSGIVSAVTADRQEEVVSTILKEAHPRVLVVEKPIVQSKADLAKFAASVEHAKDLQVFVNCARSLWKGYQEIQGRLLDRRVVIEIRGLDFGFGCNGIHFLELFRFLTQANSLKLSEASVQRFNRPHKRGVAIEDFFGVITAQNEKGDKLILRCGEGTGANLDVTIDIRTSEGESLILIDEADNSWWEPERAEKMI